MKQEEPQARRHRRLRTLQLTLLGILAYLALESFLPPARQPVALLARIAIGAYQSTGSPVMRSLGVRCRYTPGCSTYADRSYARHGTVGGTARTAWRLIRCAPWGGTGHDPVD